MNENNLNTPTIAGTEETAAEDPTASDAEATTAAATAPAAATAVAGSGFTAPTKFVNLNNLNAFESQLFLYIMFFGESIVYTIDKMVNCLVNRIGGVRYGFDDIGAGSLFADVFKSQVRYVPERKMWYCYDGKKWVPNYGAAMEKCKLLALCLEIAIKRLVNIDSESPAYKTINKYLNKWLSRRGREAILKDAETVYPISMADFDKNPLLLNCQNGTLNMVSGEFRPHNADDLLTKIAGVAYDSTAVCPRWEEHVREIMMGDQQRMLFLQQALGYALTGDTRHECFFILYGPTSRNGKGVTMETFRALMGDYARSARPETITQKQTVNSSGPSEDLARLAGARFINISEPDKKMVLSSALVKTLTGNDTIAARYLHENSFEFRMQGKLFINTNYLPQVADATVFRSKRVKVIPFERHFEANEQDQGLKAFFAQPQNLSGILNWCLFGLVSLYQNGFIECASVQLATEEYEEDSDKVSLFITDALEESSGSELFTETVYNEYKQWCMNNGHMCSSLRNFKRDIVSRVQVVRKRPAGDPKANPRSIIVGYKRKGLNFGPQPM